MILPFARPGCSEGYDDTINEWIGCERAQWFYLLVFLLGGDGQHGAKDVVPDLGSNAESELKV